VKAKYKVAVWATGGVGSYAIRHHRRSSQPRAGPGVGAFGQQERQGRPANWPGSTRSAFVPQMTPRKSSAVTRTASVYAAPAPSRMKEAIGDLCRILAAGKNIVTTSISGLVYPRGSLPDKVVDAISSAAKTGQSSLFSSGIEPGFGADLFPVALMSMSHKVYSVRGIEITNYSEYPNPYDMRELFGFGQPLDYEGGLKGGRAPCAGDWAPPSPWSPTALGGRTRRHPGNVRIPGHPARHQHRIRTRRSGHRRRDPGTLHRIVDGQDVITIEHVDRLADDLAPDWLKGRSGGTDGIWRSSSTASRASTRNSKSGIVPARATTITACWQRACGGQCDTVGLRRRARNR